MEFCHAPPSVSRLGVSGLPHPRRGASTLSTCRVASLRRLGPLPPFPGSLVKAPLVNDPYWRDLVLFHEYFHGETGQGLGASHQTGWTALAIGCIADVARLRSKPSKRGSRQSSHIGFHRVRSPASTAQRTNAELISP